MMKDSLQILASSQAIDRPELQAVDIRIVLRSGDGVLLYDTYLRIPYAGVGGGNILSGQVAFVGPSRVGAPCPQPDPPPVGLRRLRLGEGEA